ncbi:MAG: peptide ABC transporter substrate-binding protein [Opitutaceae bacterium]|nr:peptide ABC transporter substrate-binding protein [Opitutaceae bacterium]
MRPFNSARLTALAFGLALGATGCAKRETHVEGGIRTQTLLLGNSAEPRDLDPHIVTAYTDMNILVALFEGLTVLDESTSRPLPGVADHWDVSPDGLVYTFHLRPDARWSNGEPVTAHDFAYSFQRLLTPALGSEYSYMLWMLKNAEAFNTGKLTDFGAVGIAATDDATLRLTLAHPTPYLLSLAAHPTWMPVHRATIEKFGRLDQRSTAWTRPGNLVGNGAFGLTEWSPNARIIVEKNPLYWDAARTHLNRVVFLPIESSDVEEHNFRAGQMHLTFDLPATKIASYRAQNPGQLRIDRGLDSLYLNFNTTKPPLNNPKVRRALAQAIDRGAISRNVFEGAWPAAHSFTPPDCGGYTARAAVANDFAAARQLLIEAGYPGGRGLPVLPVQVLNDSKQPKLAETLQAMWQRELGVRLTIEPYEQKSWLQNQQSMTHTLALLGWVADFPDPVTFLGLFVSGGGNNWTGWSNPTYDRLLNGAASTADPDARLEILQQAEAILLAEAPIAPLVFRARTYLIHPAVRGWAPSQLGLHRYQLVELKK